MNGFFFEDVDHHRRKYRSGSPAAATRRTRACRPWRASQDRKSNRIDPKTREVYLEGGDVVRARTLVLATGVTWRRLAIDGFDRLIGDVRLSPVKRVASAVGEGSMAIAFIHKYLQEAAQQHLRAR